MKAVIDRIVQYANRYKLTDVSTGAVLGTFDFDEVTGTVQQIGTEIDKELFDSIASDLSARLIANGGNSKDLVITFTEATTLENIASGETHSTIFGKLRKWFTDRISKLKGYTYNSNIKITKTDTDDTIPSTAGLTNGTIIVQKAKNADYATSATTDKNGKDITTYVATETDPTVPAWAKATTKPSYTKAEVGLGNVDNTADEDKPISTATQNALSGKVDKVSGKQLSTNDYTTAEKQKLSNLATDTVRYGVQTLTDTQKAQARTNIGAGTSSFDGSWTSLSGKPSIVQAEGTSTFNVMSQKAVTDAVTEAEGKIPTKVSQLTNDSGYATQSVVNAKYTKPASGIPKTDLAEAVQASLNKADTALQSAPVSSVNGKTGAVKLTANDVGALPSTTTYVSSVNGKTGAITGIATEAQVNTKQNALTAPQLLAVNSGITAEKVEAYDNYKADIDKKAYTADLAAVATSGSYNSLTDKPAIPTKTSQLTNDSGYLTQHQSLTNYVTLDGAQVITGKKTFSANNAFTAETKFTHAGFAPTFTDIANGIGKSSCFTRGALMQAYIGQIIAPNASLTDATRAYAIESGKLKFQRITKTEAGHPTLETMATLTKDGLYIGTANKKVATVDDIPEDLGMTSVEATGNGNAVTSASYNSSTRKLTLTKGATFAPNTVVTTNANGLMSASDKTKLNGIAEGATKNIIDSAISSTSTNAVQNKVIKAELDKKANLSGGNTFEGKQIFSEPASDGYSISSTGYIQGSWGQFPSTGKAKSNTGKVCVLDSDGWIYYRTPSEIVVDGGGAVMSDIPSVNNGELTIQKNGTSVGTFTANQSASSTINITVPTKVGELANDKGYTTNKGTVITIKVNGVIYTADSNGLVDLGTISGGGVSYVNMYNSVY